MDGTKLPVNPNEWSAFGHAKVYYAAHQRQRGILSAYREVRRRKPTLIYINSYFNFSYSIVPRILGRLNYWGRAGILLAPRGELDPGALEIRKLKKKAFISITKLLRLDSGVTWHASAPLEVAAIRDVVGNQARVLTREDETELPLAAHRPVVNEGPMRAAFMGRIAPKKGLLLALQALEGSSAQLSFSIYGPEEDRGYADLCRSAVMRLPPNVRVSFKGSIPPDDVRNTLAHYDILLMPTSGENFGHVIAESLSVACPVMCTALTPWTELLRAGGGIVVDSKDPSAWRQAIESAASASAEERLAQRTTAGRMYERWRQESKGPHIFSLVDMS